MKLFFKTLFIINFLICLTYAHPHTFIEVFPTINIKNEKISNIHVKWVIDEMTSSMLIMDLDNNQNGKMDKKEVSYAYENYFASLANYGFYTTIFTKNNKELIKPINFNAKIKDEKLIYCFDIQKEYETNKFKINFFDKDLFVGFIIKSNFITIKGLQENQILKKKKQIFGIN